MAEKSNTPQQHDSDTAGWQSVAEEMHGWHPALQEHAARNLAERGIEISSEHHQSHIDSARPAVPNIDELPPEEQDLIGEITEIGQEALDNSIETNESAGRLPAGEELSNIITAELSLVAPSKARLAQPGERPNVNLLVDDDETANIDIESPDLLPVLQKKFVEQSARKLVDKAWWIKLQNRLSDGGEPQPVSLLSKHVLEVKSRDKDTDQYYEILEIGDESCTKEELETVCNTLRLIDQFSGGLLSTGEARRPIVLGVGLEDNAHGDALGFNMDELTFVNMSRLRAAAKKHGDSIHDALAAVIAHEVLGHQLEREVEGEVGRLFNQYFDYSEQKSESEVSEIHDTVLPKDTAVKSEPMREYGKTNAAEDLATSVGGTLAEAMGWYENTIKADPYRRDLVLGMMQSAAEKSKTNEGSPGVVGSEINYVRDEATGDLRTVPVRTFELRTIPLEDALSKEVTKLTQEIRNHSELVVRLQEPVY